MVRRMTLALGLVLVSAASVFAGSGSAALQARGQYVEARTCDVWTGPCFANAEYNLAGKNAVLAWRVETGTADWVRLDGLGVVAIIVAHNTLGLDQNGPAKAVLIV